jgi:RIP metalloprotease RseP
MTIRNVVTAFLAISGSYTTVHSFHSVQSLSQMGRLSSVSLTQLTHNTPISHSSTHMAITRKSTSTELKAMNSIMNNVASPIGALVVLATVIVVHESGHYLAARSLGMEIEEFSVGVGPSLWTKKVGETSFSIRALPLGGYVRFPENYNSTLVQAVERTQIWRESQNEQPWKRKLSSILSLGAYDELLKQEEQKFKEEQAKQKTPWWKFGKATNRKSNTGSFTEDSTQEIVYYDNPNLLQNRPWPQRAMVVAGGVIFNFILAFVIYFAQVTSPDGWLRPMVEPGIKVTMTPSSNAAAAGLLRKGDVIVGFGGTSGSAMQSMFLPTSITNPPPESKATASSTTTATTLRQSQIAIRNLISEIKATPEGESITLRVLKGTSSTEKTTSIASEVVDMVVVPKSNGKVPAIGVLLGPNIRGVQRVRSTSLLDATRLATNAVVELTLDTAEGLTQVLVSTLWSSTSSDPMGGAAGKLSGPIGLIQSGSEVVSTSDLTAILSFAAAISINLAVVNSLPLPALDGGQMVFILMEAVSRRKVDQRFQETVTSVAVLLLLFLTLRTTVGDVEGLFTK